MREAFESGGDSDLVLTFFLNQMDDSDSAHVQAALRRIIDGQSGS
jgi:hypothetical protein